MIYNTYYLELHDTTFRADVFKRKDWFYIDIFINSFFKDRVYVENENDIDSIIKLYFKKWE